MIKLNLKTSNKAQEQIKQYLEENASEVLAEKINNGVEILKDNKALINKKDLDGFWRFATEEARKQSEKGSSGAYVDNETVFSWAIHYFEEDSIEGILYNQDGTEFKPALLKPSITPTTIAKPIPKKENTQASLFDLLSTNTKEQNETEIKNEELEETTDTEKVEIEENQLATEQPNIQVVENENNKVVVDTKTGEVLTTEQIEKSFDKKSLFILMNYLPELEMR